MPEVLITALTDPCELVAQMGVSGELAARVVRAALIFRSLTGHDFEAISGFRTCRQQEQLAARGRPAAPCDVSTHTSCPATGMDFRLGGLFGSDVVKSLFGSAAVQAGLRWGGGSPLDPETNIPSDWNHVDLGPR